MWCKQLPFNVKWFIITHSSMHSTNNSVLAGVVVVVIPYILESNPHLFTVSEG